MSQSSIIRRTDKIRQLKDLLKKQRIIYLSSFFYSGKTILLNQLADDPSIRVLRFDAAQDEWTPFSERVRNAGSFLLLIDTLDRLTDITALEELPRLLSDLKEGQCAVLAGRAHIPNCLQRMVSCGEITVLDKDFVMFNEEEIKQLFLQHMISLTPSDISYLKTTSMGWICALRIAIQKLQTKPNHPLISIFDDATADLQQLFLSDVFRSFSEEEQILLCSLSPFVNFSEDMARMITGRTDAPRLLNDIAQRSHILDFTAPNLYSFPSFVQNTLLRELKNRHTPDYLNNLYQRAALYLELNDQIPEAISYYMRIRDTEKIRELLIRDTHKRPANGDYVHLRSAYAMLSRETLLSSPELMKGMCMIESLLGHQQESENWYQELKHFAQVTSEQDARRHKAEESIAYLDIALAHRGSNSLLKTLLSFSQMTRLLHSASWRDGFNAAGNSVSLINGGKDFCRWVPHGWNLYRLFRIPVEKALGKTGNGLGDIAIGECKFETNLTGNYEKALDMICRGKSHLAGDLEMQCASIGIQSRIIAAQGNVDEALHMMDRLLNELPKDAPIRLRQNMQVHRMQLQLLTVTSQEALNWLDQDAPDETGDFVILDRYQYMLKLRLYIVTAQWQRIPLLAAQLRHYFDSFDRTYLRIQLHLLQAIIDYRTNRNSWQEELCAALRMSKRYHLVRVIADEGIAILDMLNELKLPDEPWERAVMQLTRTQAVHYPGYLKSVSKKPMFTDREYQVYSLLIAGYKNAKIASILNITERTVKHYTGEIYAKLGVKSRSEAMNRAMELGDMF